MLLINYSGVWHGLNRETAGVAARAGGTGMACCRIWLDEMGLSGRTPYLGWWDL